MSQVIDLKTYKDNKKKRISYTIRDDERLQRIKKSLIKINQLMAELKEKSSES